MNLLARLFWSNKRALPRNARKIRFEKKVKTLEALLNSRVPSQWAPFGPDKRVIPNVPPLFLPATADIEKEHFLQADCPEILVASISNAIFSGWSFIGSNREVYSIEPPIMPYYLPAYIENGWAYGSPYSINQKAEQYVDGVCISVTHFNSCTYGHWLLECLPKLMLLREIRSAFPHPISILLPKSLGGFARRWCNLIVPDIPIIEFDDQSAFVRCRELIIPGQLCSADTFFHPRMNDYIDDIVQLAGPAPGQIKKHLYVTREVQSRFRCMANREEIEAIARDAGLFLISPETLSIEDQIRLFANAETITGEFGSALHNSIFSPIGTRVLALNWVAEFQSRVAHLRSQPTGYLLPDDGPLVWDRDLSNVCRPYVISPKKFREALAAHVSECAPALLSL